LARPWRLLGAVVLSLVALGLVAVASGAPLASAEGHAVSTTTVPNQPQVPIPRIIPLPNSGHAPRDAYDPGGWAQYGVLIGIVVGVGLISFMVWREVRRGRRNRDAAIASAAEDQSTRESTRSEPVDETSTNEPDSSARQ
jgi:hypothetical protein